MGGEWSSLSARGWLQRFRPAVLRADPHVNGGKTIRHPDTHAERSERDTNKQTHKSYADPQNPSNLLARPIVSIPDWRPSVARTSLAAI